MFNIFKKKNNNIFWFKIPDEKRPKLSNGNANNFGDEIGPYLFEKIKNKKPQFYMPSDDSNAEDTILSVGSVMSMSRRNCYVWGTGVMFEDIILQSPKKVCAVRGKLTQKVLERNEIDSPNIYGDPGVLMKRFYNPDIKKKYKIGIIPHYFHYDDVLTQTENDPDVLIIDVLSGLENVIDQIKSCEIILSSSLHGVIISHTYNVPCRWITFKFILHGGDFKFKDYFSAFDIDEKDVIPYKSDYNLTGIKKIAAQIVNEAPQPHISEKIQEKLITSFPIL